MDADNTQVSADILCHRKVNLRTGSSQQYFHSLALNLIAKNAGQNGYFRLRQTRAILGFDCGATSASDRRDLARKRTHCIFEGIGARRHREENGNESQNETEKETAARARRGQILLGGHGVAG